MLSLELLDLSYNFLSGSLPMSLEKLQYLVFFNVSFNNLSCEIPSRGPFTNLTAKLFISKKAICGVLRFRVSLCPSPSTHHRISSTNKHKMVVILVVTLSGAGTSFLEFIYLKHKDKGKASHDDPAHFSLTTQKRISYYELLRATNEYSPSNLIGSGSFGSVYKGTLEDGSIFTVKVFNSQLDGSFKIFDIECEILRNLRHRNIVKVISTCSNPDFKAMVLECMPNGNLGFWLYSNNNFLSAMQRLNILIDIACALQYLHCGNLSPIVHCDLKPSNALLNQEMVPDICDFGLSKLLNMEDSIMDTKSLATLCYVAAEYASKGLVSSKCDIYSFGIMLMEVFTGKSP